jgi:hypothetical protein
MLENYNISRLLLPPLLGLSAHIGSLGVVESEFSAMRLALVWKGMVVVIAEVPEEVGVTANVATANNSLNAFASAGFASPTASPLLSSLLPY